MLIIAEFQNLGYNPNMSEIQDRMEDWVYKQIGLGKFAFTLQEVKHAYPDLSDKSVLIYLSRLVKKGKIISLHRGFYLIIYPQYQNKGIMPPDLFIDGLMQYLQRPYYVGLLSAAKFHGAAHHAPQEYYVVTTLPSMRPLHKKGVKINFISVKKIPDEFLEQRKTQMGFLKVSSPILTAIDLIDFDKRVGYLNSVATILNELAEKIKSSDFNSGIIKYAKVATLQRLGYILEKVVNKPALAEALLKSMQQKKVKLQKLKLLSDGEANGFPINEKWKIIINTEIEIDE